MKKDDKRVDSKVEKTAVRKVFSMAASKVALWVDERVVTKAI